MDPRSTASADQDSFDEAAQRRLFERVLEAAALRSEDRAGGDSYRDAGQAAEAKETIIRRSNGRWVEADVPGVRYKVLWQSAEQEMRTVLYQMDAGSCFPAHVHAGTEECYVVLGDLRQAGGVMGAGDYQRMDRGSRHGEQCSLEGCLLFIRCSTRDIRVGSISAES